jgi:DNA-directed RNA polymerase subunit RPC12/RpoP
VLMDKSCYDELKEEMMEEKVTCPNCHSHSVKKKTTKKSKKPGTAGLKNPEDENIIYECLSCGKVFDKDDLLNIEMDQY